MGVDDGEVKLSGIGTFFSRAQPTLALLVSHLPGVAPATRIATCGITPTVNVHLYQEVASKRNEPTVAYSTSICMQGLRHFGNHAMWVAWPSHPVPPGMKLTPATGRLAHACSQTTLTFSLPNPPMLMSTLSALHIRLS